MSGTLPGSFPKKISNYWNSKNSGQQILRVLGFSPKNFLKNRQKLV
jgi:hypothetical protein